MNHEELKKIREEKKMTKGDFASLIGITAMMQGRYESGKIKIPDHIAEKALNLDGKPDISKDKEKDVVQDNEEDMVQDNEKDVAQGKKEDNAKNARPADKTIVKDKEKKTAEENVSAEKTTKKAGSKNKKKKHAIIHIESILGGTISTEEILERIPEDAEAVYVKPEENKAYWVNGDKTGDVDLW